MKKGIIFGLIGVITIAAATAIITLTSPPPPPSSASSEVLESELTDDMSGAIREVMEALGPAPDNVVGFGMGFRRPNGTTVTGEENGILLSAFRKGSGIFASQEGNMGCSPTVDTEKMLEYDPQSPDNTASGYGTGNSVFIGKAGLAVVKSDLTLWTAGQSYGGRLGYGDVKKYSHSKLTQIMKDILDVPAAWALAEVREAEYRKLVPPPMQSDYGKTVTRSEFCTLAMICIEQAKQMTVDEYMAAKGIDIPTSSPFTDIGALSGTAKKDIISTYALQVVSGTSATTFDPNNSITREQAAKMLTATAAALEQGTDAQFPNFTDSNLISNWAKPYIGYVFDAKIMGGVGGNKFDPKGGYQRQQAYMTMLRLYKNIMGIT